MVLCYTKKSRQSWWPVDRLCSEDKSVVVLRRIILSANLPYSAVYVESAARILRALDIKEEDVEWKVYGCNSVGGAVNGLAY